MRMVSPFLGQRKALHLLTRKIRSKSFHFASSEYAKCFLDLPTANTADLRSQTIEYLNAFDKNLWYDDPITSLVNGTSLKSPVEPIDTVNALGCVNGKQHLASPEQVEMLQRHIRTYASPYTDLRQELRIVEEKFLTRYAGFLIGNQCLDFQKQDGITEIEESIMANAIERRLNDLLLRDEQLGKVQVDRRPIYVSCVSNFSNFLDLFRKSIRSLEVGVPILVLGRSNTAQHSFRWTQLLVKLMIEQGVDPGMVTFLSCSVNDIIRITTCCRDHTGNLYTTCSRQLAANIKENYPDTVASTGGPNTLVTTQLSDEVKQAIKMSATIESAGQCTALRHCVVPSETSDEQLESIFESIQAINDASLAVKNDMFDGVFSKHCGCASPNESGYKHQAEVDAYFKADTQLPKSAMNEWWRRVVVDFSKLDLNDEEVVDSLATWLTKNQPISLAVNGPRKVALQLGMKLFDKTALVVNTIGSTDDPTMPPALTCQARPQDAEIFGEFPPRSQLTKYTRFPVVVPSSNPSYGTYYTESFLKSKMIPAQVCESTKELLGEVQSDNIRGFSIVLIEYLQDVARLNPKFGFGHGRTAVWGLQRPPIGTKTILRCSLKTTWDAVCPIFLMFYVTNARQQIELSVDPSHKMLVEFCRVNSLPYITESFDEMSDRISTKSDGVFNLVIAEEEPMTVFPMAGNFVSLYLPLGHIKSTKPNDEEFTLLACASDKWLTML